MPSTLFVCTTCRRADNVDDATTESCGSKLRRELEAAAESLPEAARPKIEGYECLMNCERACNVAIRAQGKSGFLLGGFAPVLADARALLDYTWLYNASPGGVVPYRDWPDGVRGRFCGRIPAASADPLPQARSEPALEGEK